MEIKWGNVFLALIIIYALINLPTITNNVAATISSITGAFGSAFGSNTTNSNSQVYELAKLCVLLIFVIGILRLFKNRKR
jgi:uncharacterized membrane protein YfcA